MAEKKPRRKTRRADRQRAREVEERDVDVGRDDEDEASGDDDSDEALARGSEEAEDRPNRRERRARRARSSEIRDRNLRMREEAAEKRRVKRERERAQAAAEGLDTSEMVDDALARGADTAAKLVRRHFKWLQWLIVVGVVGGFAWLIYGYRLDLANQKNTGALIKALRDENAIVKSSQPDLDTPQTGFVDTRPEFDSDKKRWAEAKREYEAAVKNDPNPARRELARLGLAGAYFEQGKYKDAKGLYEQVKSSALAGTDKDVRGRALEGLGLCLEALDKREDATKAFKELENIGSEGFKELGEYHRARLLYAAGKMEEAKKILVKALEKLDKEEKQPGTPPGFVEVASRQLLEAIDPSAAPKPSSGITAEQLEQLKKQLEAAKAGKDVAELLKSMGDAGTPPNEGSEPKPDEDEGSGPTPDEPSGPAAPTPGSAPAQGKAPAAPPKTPQPAAPAKQPAPPSAPAKPPAPVAPKPPSPAPAAPAPKGAPTP